MKKWFLLFILGIVCVANAGSERNCVPTWVNIEQCISGGNKIFLRYDKEAYQFSGQRIYVACGKTYNNSEPFKIDNEMVWFRVEKINVQRDNVAFMVKLPRGAKTLADAEIRALVRKAGTRIAVPCRWEFSSKAKKCVLICERNQETP